MLSHLRVVMSAARISWAMYMVEITPVVLFGSKIPRAILQALFFVFMAKAAGGDELAAFALVGNAVHAAVFPGIISMAIVIELEKWAGTLPHLIAAPASWLPIMIGRSTSEFADSLFSTLLVSVALFPIIAPEVMAANLLQAVPLLLITLASSAGLGWLIGAISLPIRWGTLISNMTGYAMLALCGVNIPLTALPPFFQSLARMLPMTHGLLAIRQVVDGATYAEVVPLMSTEILIGLVYALAAWLLFVQRLRTARLTGTLEQV